MTRHTELVAAVVRLLTLYGCEAFPVKNLATPRKRRDGSTVFVRGLLKPGVADVIACGPTGKFIAVEVKTGTGRLEPEQLRFKAEIERRGGLHVVARDTVQAVAEGRGKV